MTSTAETALQAEVLYIAFDTDRPTISHFAAQFRSLVGICTFAATCEIVFDQLAGETEATAERVLFPLEQGVFAGNYASQQFAEEVTETVTVLRVSYASPMDVVLAVEPVTIGLFTVAARALAKRFEGILKTVMHWQKHKQEVRREEIELRKLEGSAERHEIQNRHIVLKELRSYLKEELKARGIDPNSDTGKRVTRILLRASNIYRRDLDQLVIDLDELLDVEVVDEDDPRAIGSS
ncbi:hypothetical protein ADK67_06385 [Saccharothrix sp. NRRL B-16348]|uniref:hypothetical protein n=1 Tax=Saccharothrix sp. NRRL B-16348 TaxID=1415542 RepID=UPI0006C225DB|nr:hypothetical protein [Saccharothrix sp. NRRL B-16348]KOX33408.1 hypothetical protein ADK67_06385 [Saccharothrix sp. NRRL B-16348]